jgi:hypothetical protein
MAISERDAEYERLVERLEAADRRYYGMRDDRDRLQVLADARSDQLRGAVSLVTVKTSEGAIRVPADDVNTLLRLVARATPNHFGGQ